MHRQDRSAVVETKLDLCLARLELVLCRTETLEQKVDQLMAVSQEIKSLVSQIDAATNEIAADLTALRDQIAGGVDAATAEEIRAGLQTQVERLTALGQDPANPVPPTP
jgi:hypothetical protein